MANINSAINGLQYMQQNAQAALPVIPNNGNPAGAYNMPVAPVAQEMAPVVQPKPTLADRYPWLKPSASMDNIRAMLDQRRQAAAAPVQQPVPQQPAMNLPTIWTR